MDFYDIKGFRCPLTKGPCVKEECQWFRSPKKLPDLCEVRRIVIKYKDLLDFFSNLT